MTSREDPDLSIEARHLLWAARETGVLEALMRSAGTPAEVADETGVTERAARISAEAMADLGFLSRVDGEYEPTNRALGFLATRDVRSVGSVPHALDLLSCYRDLPETMRSGRLPDRPDDWTANDLGAHDDTDEATVRAAVTAAVRATEDVDTALDLCGGSGVYARELAARGLDVTLLDGADVIERVTPMLAPTDVTCETGSLGDVDDEWDLIFAADFLWSLSCSEAEMLLRAAADALAPGGTLVLVEPLRARSDAAVSTAVRALATGHGDCYAEADIRGWCVDAGLHAVDVAGVPGTPFSAVAASRE